MLHATEMLAEAQGYFFGADVELGWSRVSYLGGEVEYGADCKA